MNDPGKAVAVSSVWFPLHRAAAIGLLLLALAATALARPCPLLLWNASPSSPPGLYAVSGADRLRSGDMAVAALPPEVRRLASERGYLPANVPLVKPVAAAAGDRVCASGDHVYVNGRRAAARRRGDPSGRPLHWWSGCRTLTRGELFLLSANRPLAFDGRYFGVTRACEVIGRASLLWAR